MWILGVIFLGLAIVAITRAESVSKKETVLRRKGYKRDDVVRIKLRQDTYINLAIVVLLIIMSIAFFSL